MQGMCHLVESRDEAPVKIHEACQAVSNSRNQAMQVREELSVINGVANAVQGDGSDPTCLCRSAQYASCRITSNRSYQGVDVIWT